MDSRKHKTLKIIKKRFNFSHILPEKTTAQIVSSTFNVAAFTLIFVTIKNSFSDGSDLVFHNKVF